MSELKRSQSLYSQPADAVRARLRHGLAQPPPKPATEAAELCLVDAWEHTAVQGGDPYNGIGARANQPTRVSRK